MGLLNTEVQHIVFPSLADWLARWDVRRTDDPAVDAFYRAGPAGIRTTKAFSQDCYYPSVDRDRAQGCIRSAEHAYSTEGGLAILQGNLAVDGCVVKTAAVEEAMHRFAGPARVFDSQDAAVEAILGGR